MCYQQLDLCFKEALNKSSKSQANRQKGREKSGKEPNSGEITWYHSSPRKGRKKPMRGGASRPPWQAYTDLCWRRVHVIGSGFFSTPGKQAFGSQRYSLRFGRGVPPCSARKIFASQFPKARGTARAYLKATAPNKNSCGRPVSHRNFCIPQ